MTHGAGRTLVADISSAEKIFESLSAVVDLRALHDCSKLGPPDKLKCLDGTCTEILEEIEMTLQASKSTLIWLSGSPGTGKSAIAHTIASRLKSRSKLAGTFFFSRKHKDMPGITNLDFFAPTLAYQISNDNRNHLAKDSVVRSIKSDPLLLDPGKPLADQIQKLLVEPLQNLQVSWGHSEPKVLVIDAIDACEEGRICELISCLSNLLHQPRIPHLHIVITSRPHHTIDDAFEYIGCEESIHHIALDDVDVTEDIRLLFKHALERSYRNHGLECPKLESDDKTIVCLADRANGRFGAASMMIRFLETDDDDDDDDDEVPCDLDDKISLMKDPGDALHSTQIFQFYKFIINSSENPTRACRHLSTVANLAKPLAILHLRQLLGPLEKDLSSNLVSLSPIVIVPADGSRPVEFLHMESLREFLHQYPSLSCGSRLLAQSTLRKMINSFRRESSLKDKLQQMATIPIEPSLQSNNILMAFLKFCLAQPCNKTIYAATWYHEYAQSGTGTVCCAPPSVPPCSMSEDISKARLALNDFRAKPEFRNLHVFEVLSTLQALPKMLIVVILLAIRHAHPSAPYNITPMDGSDDESDMPAALTDFMRYVREERKQDSSSSPALKHACQHWGWYLSQNSTVVNKGLRTYLRTFWRDKLLSWFERQWYLEGLESCITILNIAQTIDFNGLFAYDSVYDDVHYIL